MAAATWNPSDKASNITLSNSNRTAANGSGTPIAGVRSTVSRDSGKHYFEYLIDDLPSSTVMVGATVSGASLTSHLNFSASGYAYLNDGRKGNNNSNSAYGSSYTVGDVIGVALDLDNNAIWFSKNGTWQNGATQGEIEAGTTTNAAFTGLSSTYFAAITLRSSDTDYGQITARFASADLTGTVPSGFTAGLYDPPVTIHADVAIELPPTVAATAKVSPTHGTVALSLPPTVAATAKVSPIHGTVSITLPPAVSGTGYIVGKGQVAVSLPPSIAASGTVGPSGVFDADMEGLASEMVGYAHVAGTIDAALEGVESSLSGTLGIAGTIDSDLGDLSASLVGTVTIVGVITGDLGELGAALAGYIPITGTIDASLGILGAYMVGTAEAGDTWRVIAMNLQNGAITEYESFAFNSMIEWNGGVYGANADGIYQLTGDDDDGTDIEAYARSGRTDHGTEVTKRASDVYVSAKSTTRMAFRVIADEDRDTVYEYSVPTNLHNGFDSVKSDLGRGLRARYFQYEIANVNGADFECDGFDVVVNPIERRRKR